MAERAGKREDYDWEYDEDEGEAAHLAIVILIVILHASSALGGWWPLTSARGTKKGAGPEARPRGQKSGAAVQRSR